MAGGDRQGEHGTPEEAGRQPSLQEKQPSLPSLVTPPPAMSPAASSSSSSAAAPKPVLVSTPLAPGVPAPQPAPVQSQPKTVALNCKGLRSLPYRLAHPPSVRGKLFSLSIVPRFEVRLDDILDRKHLPPLGLKDFEEWLLFVEQAAENLCAVFVAPRGRLLTSRSYFILWLRDYTQRYSDWVRCTKLSRNSTYGANPRREYRTTSALPQASPELMYSYMRAKRTFLTPNGPFELDVPSEVLAPFHTPSGSKSACSLTEGQDGTASEHAHTAWSGTTFAYGSPYGYDFAGFEREMANAPLPPDPAVFGELGEIVREMLQQSLDRFVLATYNNVGTPRAVCGSAGGMFISLVGSVPLIVNFVTGGSRWWRLAALPGVWLGLTIFISAMYGVCMMIYVFGDLRQLRSFELVRPPISAPQPHPSPSTSVASLFQPRSAPMAPGAPAFTQLNPFRRTQRRSIPEISPPMAVARPQSITFVGITDVCERIEAGPPKLHLITPSPISRWSEESGVRPPQRALTRGPRRPRSAERAVSRASTLASISDAEYTDDEDDECAHDSGYEESDCESDDAPQIEISDAYYDEHPSPEGPATAAFQGPRGFGAPLWPDYVASDEDELNATAAFIHPFSYEDIAREKEGDLEAQTGRAAAARQPVDPFDFDALPPRRPRFANPGRHRSVQSPTSTWSSQHGEKVPEAPHAVTLSRKDLINPRKMLSVWQSKCSPQNVVKTHMEKEKEKCEKEGWGIGWGVASSPAPRSPIASSPTATLAGSPVKAGSFTFPAVSPTSTLAPGSMSTTTTMLAALYPEKAENEKAETPGKQIVTKEVVDEKPRELKTATARKISWRQRFKAVQAVPAFAVPLTPVLNPVVTRAQWEIVVRSSMIAFVIAALVVGGLTGAPVPYQ
ncbi:predicted protein [Postia placenta Mad-698-R]|nr:predicted protein [Postia placenta Mad-698-R]